MPTVTALNVIDDALKEIGVLAAHETATGQDATDGQRKLNQLIDELASERLIIYTITRTTWTIASGTGQYDVATGGDVNIVRPVFLQDDAVKFQDTSLSPTTEFDLGKLTEVDWQRISQKTQTATYPAHWYYNPVYPTATLDLWPVPTSSTLQGVIYAPTAVTEFSALTDSVSLPPGYQRMLIKNLALELAPSYRAPVDPLLLRQASEAKSRIKEMNTRLRELDFEAGAQIGSDQALAYDIKLG